MPRAFLITHRRYNGIEELEESGQGNFCQFVFIIFKKYVNLQIFILIFFKFSYSLNFNYKIIY